LLAGVDGCRAGWVAAFEDGPPQVFATFVEVLRACPGLIVIDIPIGLMDSAPRRVDAAARAFLGRRACCVFSAPHRPMLRARTYTQACAVSERIDGKRCSLQAFGIFPKIRDVDGCMTRGLQKRVFEGHPEVSFALMGSGAPIAQGKKSAAGRASRLAALRPHFPSIDSLTVPRGAAWDDVLDAYALLWTARRVALGTALRLPAGAAQRDAKGLRAEILT
jgi:predicted RNase H-like nuclease